MSSSAIDQLLETVRASLHARRQEASERVEAIKGLAQAYLDAVETEAVRHFADSHGLARPKGEPRSAQALAQALFALVATLPELPPAKCPSEPPKAPKDASVSEPKLTKDSREAKSGPTAAGRSAPPPSAPGSGPGSKPAVALPAAPAVAPPAAPAVAPLALMQLERTVGRAPLVIVGGVIKPEKVNELPVALQASLEWIDTTRQGTHAIGNLEQRIRDHRVGALLILEGLVSHRHSEPLISAARRAKLPFAYAGKGGRAAMLRALGELEETLRRNPEESPQLRR